MGSKWSDTFKEYAQALIIALILAFVIRSFVVQAFKIPSGSMLPTLQIGDHLLVNKFIYG
ncbi:MAG: signal peptidase I, partial [Desulfovermiculus sp.]